VDGDEAEDVLNFEYIAFLKGSFRVFIKTSQKYKSSKVESFVRKSHSHAHE
jgi:hypothetical protein